MPDYNSSNQITVAAYSSTCKNLFIEPCENGYILTCGSNKFVFNTIVKMNQFIEGFYENLKEKS